MAGHLQVGTAAPNFALNDQHGKTVRLSDFIGKSAVVLYFYPRDNSAGCTAEACAFRDSYEAFTAAGATVIGVSGDSAESHQGFAENHRLPFVLLSDPDRRVHQLYGVNKIMGVLLSRETFVIDKQGIVRHHFVSQINMTKHVTEALEVIQSLATAQ
jgi:peroxiredoxin Q/BCP